MTDDTKYGLMIDDHEWADDEDPEPAEPPAELKDHVVTVHHTFDPEQTGGYGRHKYDVHLQHDVEDAPVAVFATKYRWKSNYWRETEQVDYHDLPASVREQVATIVACDGPQDLRPGRRVVGESGRETWRRYPGDDAHCDECPECGYSGHREDYLPADQRSCRNRKCAVAAFVANAGAEDA